MGWSLDIVRPQLDRIFQGLGMRYEAQHPDSMYPTIFITHEGELPKATMKHIASLVPDFVYVSFKQSSFPKESEVT